jgi:hypothetical protein
MQTAHPDRPSDGPLIFLEAVKPAPAQNTAQFTGGITRWNHYFAAE